MAAPGLLTRTPGLAAALALGACGGDLPADGPSAETEVAAAGPLQGYVTVERLPTPDDEHLLLGRDVWADTCQKCHGLGAAGSPKITDVEAWAPRIAQGPDVLHQHAIDGHFGPEGTMMPPRGGNPDLTDEQLIAAVDFMVANSQ